jgi:hypothetical protein
MRIFQKLSKKYKEGAFMNQRNIQFALGMFVGVIVWNLLKDICNFYGAQLLTNGNLSGGRLLFAIPYLVAVVIAVVVIFISRK